MSNLTELAKAFAEHPLAVVAAGELLAIGVLFWALMRCYNARVRMAELHSEANVKMHVLFERVLELLEDLPALQAARRRRLTPQSKAGGGE